MMIVESARTTVPVFRVDRTTSHLLSLIIVLACFSYPITTLILIKADIPTGIANIAIKGLLAALYLRVLIVTLWHRAHFPTVGVPLLLFFALYSVRLMFDLQVMGVTIRGYEDGYIYAYYFALTVLPCIAILAAQAHLDIALLYRWFLWALVIANVSLVISVLTGDALEIATLLSGRAQIDGTEEGTAILSPLTYGVIGASLASMAISRLCLIPARDALQVFGLLSCVFLGLANLMLGASRGPFFGLMLSVLVVLTLVALPGRPTDSPRPLQVATYLGLPGAALVTLALSSTIAPSFLFERLVSFAEDRTAKIKEERDFVLEAAFNDFLDFPLLGRAFVNSFDNFYPHNIPLEVLMATGMVGGLLFFAAALLVAIAFLRIAVRGRNSPGMPLALVALCYLLAGQTSGSIHSSPEFWIFFTLLLCLGLPERWGALRYRAEP